MPARLHLCRSGVLVLCVTQYAKLLEELPVSMWYQCVRDSRTCCWNRWIRQCGCSQTCIIGWFHPRIGRGP